MKIVFSTTSLGLDSEVDPRFGRGAYLLVLDAKNHDWEAHTNPGLNASGGAGIKAAQFVVDHEADAVISGDFGPNAFEALQAAGVAMYLYGDCRTVREALERFKAGELKQISAAAGSGQHRRGA